MHIFLNLSDQTNNVQRGLRLHEIIILLQIGLELTFLKEFQEYSAIRILAIFSDI